MSSWVISCRASAVYTGRVLAELSLGDAVILVRDPSPASGGGVPVTLADEGDGSVVVYSASAGVLPRNWMPAGSEITWTSGGLIAEHVKKGERLEIFIEETYWKNEAPASLDPHLEKVGKEKDLADILEANPDLMGDGLVVVGREVRTDAGPMDILCSDADDALLIVEVKKRHSGIQDLWQWKRYESSLRKDPEWEGREVHGLIVAPSATRSLIETLKGEPHVDLLRLRFEDVKHLHVVSEKRAD